MFIENKQSQYFSSHTHKCLFLSLGCAQYPSISTHLAIICLLPLSSNFYQQKRKYLKFWHTLGASIIAILLYNYFGYNMDMLDKSIFLTRMQMLVI